VRSAGSAPVFLFAVEIERRLAADILLKVSAPSPPAADSCHHATFPSLWSARGGGRRIEETAGRGRRCRRLPVRYDLRAVGDRAKALASLDVAMRLRDLGMVYLKTDPLMDPLRQERRFQAVMRELNFPD
jgi:hypothetical protein